MMTTSKNKLLILLMLLFVFFAAVFAVLLGLRLSQQSPTIGNPNAAISCDYCDKAFDKVACRTNCEAVNTTNSGSTCPAGTVKQDVVRNDGSAFSGCRPSGAYVGTGVQTGEACNNIIPTIPGYSKSYYGFCMYEPVTNCKWWNGGNINSPSSWQDCGCAAVSDATVQTKCNASNAGKQIEFKCSNCGQDAAVVCPGVYDPATSRSFNGTIQCTDNGVLKPVSNVQVQVVDAATGTVKDTKTTGTDGKFNLIAPNEPTSDIKYTVKVSSTTGATPALTSTLISAVGFSSPVQTGCTPGASNEANSSTYCNTKCNAGPSNSSYDSCAAGTGVSNGYNFNVGNCNTVIPSYVCYKCDKTTWTVTSNSQATACDEVNNFKDQAGLTSTCVAPQVITCYSCNGGVVKEDKVVQTGTAAPICPTGTSTTKPASCKVTCNQCQDQNGSSVNVSKDFNDVTTCPTGWNTTQQACKNTCYFCDKTTDPNSWKVSTVTNTNQVCDSSKGEFSDPSNVVSCVSPKPDVTIEKKAAKYQLAYGENAVFTITVKNISTVNAIAPISVVDNYDAGLEYVSYTSADFTCGTVDTVNRKYECKSTANLNAGESKYITVTYKVTQSGKDLNNFAFVSLPSAPNGTTCVNGTSSADGKNETNCANNNATDKVTMAAFVAPDVTIEKKAAKYELSNGENAVFTIKVWNLSDTVAKAPVKVDDSFDAGLQFITANSTDFTCGTVDATNRKFSCTSDKDLVKGEVRTITVTYKVLDTNKEYSNNAFVSLPSSPNGTVCTNGNTSSTGSNETNCSNNNSTDKVIMKPGVVETKPLLNATKNGSASCDTTNTYSTIKYSITLTNSGNASGNIVLLTDTLDTKLTNAEITNISDNGARSGNKITWGSLTLPAGSIKVLTYSVKVKASDVSSVVNSVDFDVKETGQKVSVQNTVKVSCVTTLPKSSVDSADKLWIMGLFASVILIIGFMGYKLNIASFAATYRGRKVGSRKFESDFSDGEM